MPTRRTLAKGAAWSVPALAVSSLAPAYAVSPKLCPTTSPCVTGFGTGGCWNGCSVNYSLLVNSYSTTKVQVQTSLRFSIPAGVTVPSGTTFTFTYAVFGPNAPTAPTTNGEFGPGNWGTWSTTVGATTSVTVGTLNGNTSVGCYLNADNSVPTATNYPMCCPDPCASPCTRYEFACSPVCTGTLSLTQTIVTMSVKLSGAITGPDSLCGGVSYDQKLATDQVGGYELLSVSSSSTRICNQPKKGQLFTNENTGGNTSSSKNTSVYGGTGRCDKVTTYWA